MTFEACEKHCEANAFKIVIRGLEGEVARLKERLADPMREVQRLGQEIEQEPVCDKDPQGCWNVRCQLGKKCKNTPPQRTEQLKACVYCGQLVRKEKNT